MAAADSRRPSRSRRTRGETLDATTRALVSEEMCETFLREGSVEIDAVIDDEKTVGRYVGAMLARIVERFEDGRLDPHGMAFDFRFRTEGARTTMFNAPTDRHGIN